MSSEEIVSVVRSEVMPLEYGGMDSKSSPSSSERTVEGVGGGEVVGVGGDSVPITMVEVEGRRERCCDVDADIVSRPRTQIRRRGRRCALVRWVPQVHKIHSHPTKSKSRTGMGRAADLKKSGFRESSKPHILPAGVEERACSVPRDHWMPVYVHYLAAGLRFPIPELLGGSRKDKGWYYFTPRVANRESRALFTASPSSIKGWKEKFLFVDDMEWERGDAEVEVLSSWKAKKANQNNVECIEAAELYEPSALSEAEMDKFLGAARGVAIPKKPRKKSKTSTKQVDKGGVGKEKKKVVEEEERGSEVPQFVPQPPLVELDPKLREFEEGVEVRALGKGKGLVPPLSLQSSLFEAKNTMGASRFINSTFLEVDKRHAREEALRYCGALVVKHVLEKEKEELEKKNKEMQEVLDKVVPAVKQLDEREAQEKEIKLMKEAVVELKKNMQLLVHNGMEEHITNFISSSSFDNIVNLYRLPTTILAFTDCKKKVKAEYPEVDITKITFGEQEEGVEENDGCTVFPPSFDFEFVVVKKEEAEVGENEVGAGVEGIEVEESQPP
ncbi:hypothetical protein SLEP1_g24489 [Rubroshorea leprosula]|uniref:Uncharacterized protein n=1 Tax=Rubroshorea leprosula TaxID=152421 RepID=A0AAV5JPM4_9ROSI|nr:hypothetical protein SLEP1_g24489 [Rubroshorea leprosula]